MQELAQRRAPLFEALKEYRAKRVVRFDVPGHKGRGAADLSAFLGPDCVASDFNSSKPLDNLIHPSSVIAEAQSLAAEAFGAAHAFFMVSGTSGSVQAMIWSTVQDGEKLIMPRNVHRSAINALVMCGAVPVYVNPGVNRELGIPLGMAADDVAAAIKAHPDAKAVLVNNPTYYGVCSDLRAITDLAHRHGMRVLVDEAHGTHFYFGDRLPISAMACGCDMAAVSVHKTGGSLTQSSLLLAGPSIDVGHVNQVINLTQTTSASYLLLASLDIARRSLALNGRKIFRQTVAFADYARREINRIGAYIAFAADYCDRRAFYAFDSTKLSIHTLNIGLAGVEVYDLLRDEYDIQIEFGDLGNVLAIISAGDRALELERLITALAEIKRLYSGPRTGMLTQEYIEPELVLPPRAAFFAPGKSLPRAQTLGEVAQEFVMCYPPGIPILAPGERITRSILDYIDYAKEKGSFMTGTQDMEMRHIRVVDAAGRPRPQKGQRHEG